MPCDGRRRGVAQGGEESRVDAGMLFRERRCWRSRVAGGAIGGEELLEKMSEGRDGEIISTAKLRPMETEYASKDAAEAQEELRGTRWRVGGGAEVERAGGDRREECLDVVLRYDLRLPLQDQDDALHGQHRFAEFA